MVEYILGNQAGETPLLGYSRLHQKDHKLIAVVCALASKVPDAVLALMLEDNRGGSMAGSGR
eukprot:5192048-Lingulodinium_polyedra.AAC.1